MLRSVWVNWLGGGVGGFVGVVLAGVFCAEAFGGTEGDVNIVSKVGVQLYAGLLTAAYTAIASYAAIKVTERLVGLRVSPDAETQGLDLALHEESGYRY